MAEFARSEVDEQQFNTKRGISADGVVHVIADFSNRTRSGTGFVFFADETHAFVMTAEHILSSDEAVFQYVMVCFSAERCGRAEVVSRNEWLDVAGLKVDCYQCAALAITRDQSLLFREYLSLIYPAGQEVATVIFADLAQGPTVHAGRTARSYLGEELTRSHIDHDIYLGEGSSGSPLFNMAGEVIGINLGSREDGKGVALYLDLTDKLVRNVIGPAQEG